MNIRLITLGGLSGSRGDTELDWLRSQSLRAALLTYLALERTSTRDAVQLLLWPDAETASANGRLKTSVFELRRALDEHCIATKGRTISAGSHLTADASEFEDACNRKDYENAFGLFRGEFLAGLHLVDTNEFETWVDARRARHARMFRKACRAVIESHVQAGNHAGALAAAETWVDRVPLDDEARHRLIELQMLAGNRSEAIEQYQIHARMLARDGLEPLPETRELIATLKRDGQGHGPTSSGTTLMPLSHPIREKANRLGDDVDPRLEPTVLHNLEVLRQIGAGTAARVYLARDVALQRLVAVKVPLPELANDAKARARFEREARAAARVTHTNIVTVYQVSHLADGTPYLVTEFVEGRNLTDTLAAEGVLSELDACRVLRQLVSALEAAHAKGLIHRDVRPANIMWTRETGRAVLMDFGIVAAIESGTQARESLTAKGEVLGDSNFASPEQLLSGPVTAASDIYSLGVVGYVLITGSGPYPNAKGPAAIHARFDQIPQSLTQLRPQTDSVLSDLLMRCLSLKPEHRPSAREVGRVLDRVLDSASNH